MRRLFAILALMVACSSNAGAVAPWKRTKTPTRAPTSSPTWTVTGTPTYTRTPTATPTLTNTTLPTMTPTPEPPSAPVVAVTANADGSILVSWSPSAAPYPVAYEVSRALTSGGPWTALADTENLSYMDTGLTGDTEYFYRVMAYMISEPAETSATTTGSLAVKYGLPGLALGGAGLYFFRRRRKVKA